MNSKFNKLVEELLEGRSWAQQAAIAISLQKAGKKPKPKPKHHRRKK